MSIGTAIYTLAGLSIIVTLIGAPIAGAFLAFVAIVVALYDELANKPRRDSIRRNRR